MFPLDIIHTLFFVSSCRNHSMTSRLCIPRYCESFISPLYSSWLIVSEELNPHSAAVLSCGHHSCMSGLALKGQSLPRPGILCIWQSAWLREHMISPALSMLLARCCTPLPTHHPHTALCYHVIHERIRLWLPALCEVWTFSPACTWADKTWCSGLFKGHQA